MSQLFSGRDTLSKDFKALFVPFLILNAICLVASLADQYVLHHTLPDFATLLKIIGISLIGMGEKLEDGVEPVCIYLWFFVALFIIHLLASLGYRRAKAWVAAVAIVCLVCAFTIISPQVYNVPMSVLMAFPFFAIGFLGKSVKNIDTNAGGAWTIIVLVAAALAYFFLVRNDGPRPDINGVRFGDNVAMFYLTALVGIVMACAAAMVLSSISPNGVKLLMTDFAAGALVLVGLHGIPVSATHKILGPFNLPLTQTTPIVFASSLLIMVVFVFVIRLARRYFPIILGGR